MEGGRFGHAKLTYQGQRVIIIGFPFPVLKYFLEIFNRIQLFQRKNVFGIIQNIGSDSLVHIFGGVLGIQAAVVVVNLLSQALHAAAHAPPLLTFDFLKHAPHRTGVLALKQSDLLEQLPLFSEEALLGHGVLVGLLLQKSVNSDDIQVLLESHPFLWGELGARAGRSSRGYV